MNTTQLECFLSVANFLNFSRAAQQLQITQPAVSHQINSLEDELGVKLFIRTSKNVRLSRAGIMFVQYAEDIMKLSALSKAKVKDLQETLSVRLGIGCRNFIELRLLKSVLELLRIRIPQLSPMVRLNPYVSLENLLEDDDVQVIFTFKESAPAKSVYQELIRCPIACVCAAEHPLASYEHLSLSQLQNMGKIAICPPTMYPPYLSDIQGRLIAGRETEKMLFCDNMEVMYTLVEAGYAFGIIPDIHQIHFQNLCYIPVDGLQNLSYGVAYLKGTSSTALHVLLEALKEVLSHQE